MSKENNIKKITVPFIIKMKEHGEKIAVLTAYDALMASILDESGIDIILVGDSGGMVLGGHKNTLSVNMDEMIQYAKSASKGVKRALLVADLPFLSYQCGIDEAIKNSGRFLKEAEVEAVKLEGGKPVLDVIKRLVDFGIPVMGHLGLTPQSIHKFGGYYLQGNEEATAEKLLEEATLVEEAGAFSIVLEKIPAELAEKITKNLKIPTIGIGAGPGCDGQVLVTHDMLGLNEKFKPKFVRRYLKMGSLMQDAFMQYIKDVKSINFPSPDESF